jgi:ADP-ribose pyrophosphatase
MSARERRMMEDEATVRAYLELRRARADLFDRPGGHGPGAIDLVCDEAEFPLARAEVAAFRCAHGLDARDTRIGVLADDPYMVMVRDPVRFPDGSFGLYNRIVEGRSVAALPLLAGCIVLVRVFRHGMRRWSIEFPRGGCDAGEPPETAIRRELAEEIGARVRDLVDLGDFTPGGSTLSIIARLFVARLDGIGMPAAAEGIGQVLTLEPPDVERMIAAGDILDGFTMSTFLRARLAGLV